MSKIYDTINMHFDDVFVIYTKNRDESVSSTDYIYFDEADAQEEADALNKEFPVLKHYAGTLTEFVEMLNEK